MRRGHQAAIEAAFQKASQANQGRNKGSEEDEKKITQNGHAVPVEMSVPVPVLQGGAHKQGHSQGQPAGPIVCWERFLPVKALRVLLVENDDCTRHVVSALLRNCSYEVITAANGIQAWKILIDLNNHIDLVLTEVVMPCISGIGLLGKIMSHKTRKNIPVIMMSSNDSMGTVFRCLSKGAVDFLVKPIRKNELKNLWQHIWRRCHSSSGSGSESAIRTQKGDKTNSGDDSEHNSRSTDNEENTSVGLNARDNSDNGSGTQMSSWTKCAVEVESPKAMSLSDQLVDPPDSTCAQVIHPKPELYCNTWLPITTNLPTPLPHKRSNDEFMGKDLEIGVPGNSKNSEKEKEAGGTVPAGGTMMMNIDDKTPNCGEKTENATHGSARFDEPSTQAADLIGSIAKTPTDAQLHTAIPNKIIYDGKDKELGTFTVLPSLELSLKRLRSVTDNGAGSSEDRKVLRRSEVSAFTRYHTSSAASNQAPTGGTGGYGWSCSPVDNNTTTNNNSSEAVKTDLANDPNLAKQGSNGSSNNNDMGSTTKNVFATRQAAPKDKVASPSAVKNNQHTSAFQPVQFRPASTATPPNPQVMEDDGMKADGQDLPRDKEFKVQHHHHHHHHYHHHHHSSQQQQQQQEQQKEEDEQQEEEEEKEGTTVMESTGVTGAPAGTVYSNPVEGQAANYKSLNGSNSGSNHGSNGQNGVSTAGHGGGGVNVENGNGMAEKNGAINGNESGSGVYQNRAAQREAALNKFREKRKARNFGKKVRYQSRKRLAEQRPRVRGQFVRQNNNNNNNNNNNGREVGER